MESANALGVFGVEKAKFHPPSGILPRSQTGGHWVQISEVGAHFLTNPHLDMRQSNGACWILMVNPPLTSMF